MSIELSARTTRIKPSPTMAMSQRAKKMQQDGGDIISLTVGEPDFDTPDHIKEAAIEAIGQGHTKYTAGDGIIELKEAIQNKFEKDNHLNYDLNQLMVSCGAKQCLYNLYQALLNPGDEVLIPTPYWVSYPDMALLADAKPVFIRTNSAQKYKITPEQLKEHITDKTRLFVLNSPSNPSGMAYNQAELAALGEVLLEYPNIIIVSDDIYEHILWTHNEFSNILTACPDLYDRTVVINGVSKAYAMTGWRIGYAGGPAEIIAAMRKVQSQSTSNPTSISQYAAIAALNGDQQCVKDMLKAYKSRSDFLVSSLNEIEGINALSGNGTFYTFPDVSGVIKNLELEDDIALCERILTKTGVATIPGSAFGMPGCIRMSFATSMEKLNDAVKRLKTIL